MNVQASSDSDTKSAKIINSSEAKGVAVSKNESAINNESVMDGLTQIGNETKLTQEVKEEAPALAKITTYGTDCYGCVNVDGYGGTANGVKLSFNAVQQSDGSWKEGITYDGYYIVAANTSIPIGSIIEVSNHGISGSGLVEGQPFYAMVLDRGAMTLNHLDLFVGSEKSNSISINRNYAPTMKIIRSGY